MAQEGITLNGLSLNNATTHRVTNVQLPIPAKKPEWIEGADADGAVLMRDPLVQNGTMVINMELLTASKDATGTAIGAIVDELEEADRSPAGIPVVWTPANGTKSLTFYALSGEITELPLDQAYADFNNPKFTITLTTRPGGYGTLVTGPSQTTTGPLVALAVPDVTGDMPTDEAYVVITDMSSQTRRHVEWGAEYLHYNNASPSTLILDSDSMTVSGFGGALATFSGAYDPNATGNNVISGPAFSTASALLGTGTQTHIGTFRVKARVYVDIPTSATYNARFRLAWRIGDGQYSLNDWATPPAANADFYFSEVDLGLITIPVASAGAQSWDGRLEVITDSASSALVTCLFDYFILVPVEAGYGRARSDQVAQAGTVTAYDLFNQTAGNLNTSTMGAGGNWITNWNAATDFVVSGSGTVTRNANSETAWAGRYAVAGTTTATDVAAHLDMRGYNVGSWQIGYHGLLLRFVDLNNWLAIIVNPGLTAPILSAVKSLGGTKTTIASGSVIGPSGYSPGANFALDARVDAAGAFSASVVVTSSDRNGTYTITGQDSVLATGGTLASGKSGFYSDRQGPATTYTFDNFIVTTTPALAPAVYSGRTLEVTSAETRRQNSAGTAYGIPWYRGSRFTLNPEGSASRVTRVVAKAHRNDVEVAAATSIADQLKVQVFYRPRYSVVPR